MNLLAIFTQRSFSVAAFIKMHKQNNEAIHT